jgi:transposase
MAAWRRAIELSLGDAETAKLRSIAQSRTEPVNRVERARILLAYREDPSFFAVGRALGLHHQTVQRCVERAVAEGPLAALDDRPRPGREPTITLEAKAWLVSLACRKAKDLGYPHELWTTRLLARHAREHGPAEGHACLANLAQGTVCKILDQEEVKPHKVRYYLEQRDPDFAEKMAEVLCVYRQVKILKQGAAASKKKRPSDAVAIISYDEKPGIQAIATTAPDLPPEPGAHATFAREHEYKRHGTVSLLAGIDLVTGKVHALVKDRHRSREFIEFLELLDSAYPARTAIKLILDNHSAISRGKPKPGLPISRCTASNSLSPPITDLGSISSRASSRNSPVPSCATFASPPSRSSRIASWPPWTISTAIPSFTPGPTSSTRPHDMIRTSKSLV